MLFRGLILTLIKSQYYNNAVIQSMTVIRQRNRLGPSVTMKVQPFALEIFGRELFQTANSTEFK